MLPVISLAWPDGLARRQRCAVSARPRPLISILSVKMLEFSMVSSRYPSPRRRRGRGPCRQTQAAATLQREATARSPATAVAASKKPRAILLPRTRTDTHTQRRLLKFEFGAPCPRRCAAAARRRGRRGRRGGRGRGTCAARLTEWSGRRSPDPPWSVSRSVRLPVPPSPKLLLLPSVAPSLDHRRGGGLFLFFSERETQDGLVRY